MKLFLQKNAKFLSAGGSAPRPPCLRRLGALPPNPQPPAAGGFASRPPLASGGWGLRPQTPQTAPPLRISGYAPGYSATFLLSDWFISQRFAVASLRIVTLGMEFCGVTLYNA